MRIALLAFAAILPACACRPSYVPAPLEGDAAVELDADVQACAPGCQALQAAGCEEGLPTAEGESCADLCQRTEPWQRLPSQCLAGLTTVAAIRVCGVRCANVDAGP